MLSPWILSTEHSKSGVPRLRYNDIARNSPTTLVTFSPSLLHSILAIKTFDLLVYGSKKGKQTNMYLICKPMKWFHKFPHNISFSFSRKHATHENLPKATSRDCSSCILLRVRSHPPSRRQVWNSRLLGMAREASEIPS